MDLSEIQHQVVAYRIEGTKLYRDYSQTELEIYKKSIDTKLTGEINHAPLQLEKTQFNFDSHKIIPKLSTKQLEHKVASAEKALEFSFKMY